MKTKSKVERDPKNVLDVSWNVLRQHEEPAKGKSPTGLRPVVLTFRRVHEWVFNLVLANALGLAVK